MNADIDMDGKNKSPKTTTEVLAAAATTTTTNHNNGELEHLELGIVLAPEIRASTLTHQGQLRNRPQTAWVSLGFW